MTKSRPAGGSRTLVGLLSTFALVGGVVGFQNAATAQEAAMDVAPRGVGTASDAPATEVPPEAVPAPAPVVEAPVVEAPVVQAPVVQAPAPAPEPAPAVVPQPAPAPAQPSGTTGGSGG